MKKESKFRFIFSRPDDAIRITVFYIIGCIVWKVLTDSAIFWLDVDNQFRIKVTMLKGWAFIILSAFYLYLLIKSALEVVTHARQHCTDIETIYKNFSENTEEVLWRCDTSTFLCTYVSPSVSKLLGYTQQEFLELSIEKLTGKDYLPMFRIELPLRIKRFEQGDISQKIKTQEIYLMHKEGQLRPVEIITTLCKDAAGKVGEILGISRDISERIAARTRLLQSEARTLAIFENTADWIWSVDPHSFGLTTFNKAFREYFRNEFSLEVTYGMKPENMLIANHALLWNEFYRRALWEGSFSCEYNTSTCSHTLLLSFNLLKQEETVFGISVFGKNITERKRTELEIFEQKNTLDGIFESAPFIMLLVDFDIKALNLNSVCALFTGGKKENLLGLQAGQLFKCVFFTDLTGCGGHKSCGRCPLRYSVNMTVSSGQPVINCEGKMYLQQTDSIKEFDMLVSTALIMKGEERYVLLTIADISERKNAEKLIIESELRFRSVFRLSPEVISIKRLKDDVFADVNEAFEKVTGFCRAEVIGKTSYELNLWADIKQRGLIRSQLIKEGSVNDIEIMVQKKDNSLIYCTYSATILEIKNELLILSIKKDITNQKMTDVSLKASLHEKDILLRELYHRTKNNMQVICSLLSLKSDSLKDTQMIGVLREMADRIHTMAMVHQKLYQSQNLSKIDLGEYIRDLSSYLMHGYNQSADRIELILDLQPVEALIDSAIPCGLLINELVTNSLKYAFPDNKAGQINILLRKSEEDTILLRISDNGGGIARSIDPDQCSTLGMQILYGIGQDQLGGVVTFETTNGVTCTIEFKERYSPRV